MKTAGRTVESYLASLPADRGAALRKVRKVILANLPDGYEESMEWGMPTYQVPLAVYPDTYNKRPLMYAAFASQKNYMTVYLSGIYGDDGQRARFERSYRATGKKYDVGQSCVRFKTLDDLPLEVIGKAIAAIPMKRFVAHARAARRTRRRGTST
jgi:hypothetical protein